MRDVLATGEAALRKAKQFVVLGTRPRSPARPPTEPPADKLDRLDNTLKPDGNLKWTMTLEEARIWLRKFDQWFKWNTNVLQKKGLVAQRVLLENFLDNRMLSKVQSDGTINKNTPVQGPDGLLKRLESYYTDDLPTIIRRHNFISCKQERGEKFMAWWERKLQKGQECSHTDMTPNDWLQLELLRNVYDSELQRKLLEVREPKLEELIKIATL